MALAVLLAAAAAAMLLGARPQVAAAEVNDNQTQCQGQLRPGGKDPDDPSVRLVRYRVACSNPLTGYQLVPTRDVQGFETEVFASDQANGQVVPGDAFSCQGDIPGAALNCVGAYSGHYHQLEGTFTVNGNPCRRPALLGARLTVMRAYLDSKGKIAQAIAGPFDLGRVRGCPKPTNTARAKAKAEARTRRASRG